MWRNKIYSIVILLFIFLVGNLSYAQQGHFTQFFNAPLYVNPAEAGSEDNIRVGFNFRRQWPSIVTGFTTRAINADMMIGKLGYGLVVSTNDAGQASLNRTNALLNVAHHLNLNSKNRLSAGIQIGLSQYSLNTSELQFDSQYTSGSGFNSNNASGENLGSNSTSFLNTGLGLTFRNKSKWNPTISFSIKNLIEPRVNFVALGNNTALRQLNVFGEINKKISPKVSLIPYLFFAAQSEASYLQSGLRFGYELASKEQLEIGLGLLKKDAVLAYVGIPLKNIKFGMSYDLNTSKLSPATNGIGAWEFSISIRFRNKLQDKRNIEKINKEEVNSLEFKPKHVFEVENSIVLLKKIDLPINASKPSKEELKIMQATISNKIERFEPIEFTTIKEEEKVNHYFVYFDSDKSLIKSEYKVELDRLVTDLKKMGSFKVLVYGHTDSDGDSMYNIYLGNARAKQVMSYLVENGIPLENIETFTYGKTSPIVANTTKELKAKNRRAEILIIRK